MEVPVICTRAVAFAVGAAVEQAVAAAMQPVSVTCKCKVDICQDNLRYVLHVQNSQFKPYIFVALHHGLSDDHAVLHLLIHTPRPSPPPP